MLLVRPAERDDVEDLLQLALKAGKGLTSMPYDKGAMVEKVESSVRSFQRKSATDDDHFLFVMEDLERQKVVGTSAIFVRTGARQAFYAYRVHQIVKHSHSLDRQITDVLLLLTNDYSGCSEVGTFFLDPNYRGNGRILAKARYMFMGLFRERFQNEVIAEMRGWVDHQGESPFWEAIGRSFFDMSYEEADRLCGTGSNLFITELMPRYPIYGCLLPDQARQCIGRPHDQGVPAKILLEREGFEYEGIIDIFDGGPMLKAKVDNLKTVKMVRSVVVTDLEPELGARDSIIANPLFHDFRVVRAPAKLSANENLYLNSNVKAALGRTGGETVAFVSLE